jgi:hypothetical protein
MMLGLAARMGVGGGVEAEFGATGSARTWVG